MRRLRSIACGAGLIFQAILGAPVPAQAPESFHDIGGIPIATPIPWARPLAGGPLNVVAIAPYSTLADMAQLKAHMELNLETVAIWDRQHLGFDPLYPEPLYPDATHEAVEKRLAKALGGKKIDVIVIGQCDPAAFPDAIQEKVIARVEAGAGLVITSSGALSTGTLAAWLNGAPQVSDPPGDTHASGPLGLPRGEQDRLVSYRSAGAGRIAHLSFQSQPSPNHALIPIPINPYLLNSEHESNAFSLACKTILWAAGRQPGNTVSRVLDITPRGPDDEEIPPGYPREFVEAVRRNAFNQPLRPYVLELDGPAETAYNVVYQLRVPGASVPAWRVPDGTAIPKGESRCALDIIATPGDYFLDVWLATRKGIVFWHTEPIAVRGWPQIASVSILQEGKEAVWLHPNDHLDLQVEVEPGAFLTSGEAATVFARAVDSFDRQVASAARNVGPEGGMVTLRLELADLIAPLIQVEIFAISSALISDTGLAGQAARLTYYFPVRLPDAALEPAVILSAEGPFDYGAIRQMAQLREKTGARLLHAPAGVESLLAASAAGLARLPRVGSLDAGRVGGGETRVPCLSSEIHWERETARIKAGVLESWGGGPAWYSLGSGGALTETEANVCQSPDCLARFRAYLQGQYAGLDALNEAWGTHFASWDQMAPLPLDQCQQEKLWAPWLDFRQAMNLVFANALERGRAAVREIPGAGRAGFVSPAAPITPVMGYDWHLLGGATDFLTAPAVPHAMRRIQAYHPGRPYSGIVVGYRQLQGVSGGAGQLPWETVLRQIPAIWLEDPFSQGPHNLIAPSGASRPGFADLTATLEIIGGGVGALLLNARPHPTGIAIADNPASRLLDYADPEPGRTAEEAESWLGSILNQAGFTALVRSLEDPLGGLNTIILSRSRVLSDAAIGALMEFHNRGGLILADGPAGQLDGHGVPRPRPPLPFLHPMHPDAPGDGLALWTNRPVWVGQLGETADPEEVLGQLLARAGNTPAHPIRLPEKQAGEVARFQFTYGDATIIACLPDSGAATTVRRASLDVPDGHFGHALLSPEATTSRRRLQWAVAPGQAALFTLLPYRVAGLKAAVPEFAVAGHRLPIAVHLDTGDTAPGDHFIVCSLIAASGIELKHYRRSLNMTGGLLETYIPLAENEAPGYYTLSVVDVLTQQKHEQLIQIQ